MNNHKPAILSNHGRVLFYLAKNPTATIQNIAEQTGLSVAGVQKIIMNLEENKYVTRTKIGRSYRYEVQFGMPLRKASSEDYSIADVLGARIAERS